MIAMFLWYLFFIFFFTYSQWYLESFSTIWDYIFTLTKCYKCSESELFSFSFTSTSQLNQAHGKKGAVAVVSIPFQQPVTPSFPPVQYWENSNRWESIRQA